MRCSGCEDDRRCPAEPLCEEPHEVAGVSEPFGIAESELSHPRSL
jgi:hypothetical protein